MAELTRHSAAPPESMESDSNATPSIPVDEQTSQTANSRAVRVWQFIFVGILLFFVGVLAFRLWDTNVQEQRASGLAPEFTFTTFEGETISLDDLQGRGVVLNFWASWCDPCREEAALLEATWRREQDNGVMFIGLDYLDQEPAALDYIAEYDITYPNGPDLQSKAARRYGIKGVPETYFITPQGEVAATVIGPITSPQQLEEHLAKIRP